MILMIVDFNIKRLLVIRFWYFFVLVKLEFVILLMSLFKSVGSVKVIIVFKVINIKINMIYLK